MEAAQGAAKGNKKEDASEEEEEVIRAKDRADRAIHNMARDKRKRERKIEKEKVAALGSQMPYMNSDINGIIASYLQDGDDLEKVWVGSNAEITEDDDDDDDDEDEGGEEEGEVVLGDEAEWYLPSGDEDEAEDEAKEDEKEE